jgi:hypothetical protein
MSNLKKIFKDAYLTVVSEGDGFILVKDTYSLYMTKYDESNRYIEFVIFNDFKDSISQTVKYEFTNKINSELIEVTAHCNFEKIK